jgi:threonine dehydrogenase-like Zn-dependent dehydrogenase
MKINFAQVPAQDVDTFGDDNLFGPDESGNFYYNYLEFGTNPGGTEEVAIVDGCDRFMPISVDNIPELIAALAEVYKISQSLEAAQRIEQYATSNAQAYVTESHIEYESVRDTASWITCK